ncbi:cytochrome c biogenesis heme-transporting ATPase CcmA [Congregibacter variabilis]|uniref:Cytochrome c biogenesis heme-transporting ATPase CcmA n=1 Tax=Congregibacter variabilis TaxID=3081200 RepID=A0ABZ0I478_9GAMM|nr:cytochrome c biogenesis heme-transporting ATPase CcmA [Congregibacter sp. IMCC43200]
MSGSSILEAIDLGIERGGRQLFSGFSFSLSPGDIVHLRGENGAGKTTLLRMLAGLSRYGFDGVVHRHSACLFLGHQSAVKGLLSPRENLHWHPSGESFSEDQAIDEALAQVGLYGYEDVPAAQLSAGQQRRVDLARLYLSQKPLWLLDEPFTAIDTKGMARLQQRFVEHAAAGGAVLLSSHQALDPSVNAQLLDLPTGRRS